MTSRGDDGGFRYRELDFMEFRLLKVLPERTAIINCDIVYASLEDPPPYTAVSYAWGDVDDTQKIEIGGDRVDITSSLHGALAAVRNQATILVWADAVCINQRNKDERTKQVQLMSKIYERAESVAIWLGPEADGSDMAAEILCDIAANRSSLINLEMILKSADKGACATLLPLFERDYWERLWIVQELFFGRRKTVYCGNWKMPWQVFEDVSNVFKKYEEDLRPYFLKVWSDDDRRLLSRNRLQYSFILKQGGPGGFPDVESFQNLRHNSLFEILYACRAKLAAEPRDKVFAIIGLLPREIRNQFPPNYNKSVKNVYIQVVDYLLHNTHRLEIICEAIHFPLHISPVPLPSWVPDWSHIPQRDMVRRVYDFKADKDREAIYKYLDDRGNPSEIAGNIIEIIGIRLDTIVRRGVAVGRLYRIDDLLMAFLNWRAILLENDHDDGSDFEYTQLVREAFCRTLCLGHMPRRYRPNWTTVCYHVFASLIDERLKRVPLDPELRRYAKADLNNLRLDDWKQILDEACHHSMQGRSFCVTRNGLMGLGSGFLEAGDIVIVALGCYTPIILRQDVILHQDGGKRNHKTYRFVGDIYIDGYMYGKAVEELAANQRELESFVLR